MKSQFVGGGTAGGLDQYLDCSLRGLAADTRSGPSASLIADIKIMQDFAASNPDKANTASLNAWVEKVMATATPEEPAAKPASAARKPTMTGGM